METAVGGLPEVDARDRKASQRQATSDQGRTLRQGCVCAQCNATQSIFLPPCPPAPRVVCVATQSISGPAGGARAAWVCAKLAGAMQPIMSFRYKDLRPRRTVAPPGRAQSNRPPAPPLLRKSRPLVLS